MSASASHLGPKAMRGKLLKSEGNAKTGLQRRGLRVGQRVEADLQDCCKLLKIMVGTTGFEPATSSVSRKRSNQLSYAPVYADRHLVYQDRCSGKRRAVAADSQCCTIYWRNVEACNSKVRRGLSGSTESERCEIRRRRRSRVSMTEVPHHAPEPAEYRAQPAYGDAHLPGTVSGGGNSRRPVWRGVCAVHRCGPL